MPAGTEIFSADHWGKSSWNNAVRIDTLDPDKCEKQYFLKVSIDRFRFASCLLRNSAADRSPFSVHHLEKTAK